MASPPHPDSRSPPAPAGLSLPRQRPTLVLPGNAHRRTSIASASSSSHPLRQTSFPPADRHGDSNAVHSPVDSLDDDSDILSAVAPVNNNNTQKRKRGEKRQPGRPPKNPRDSSVVNGTDDGKSRTGAKDGSLPPAEGEGSDADDLDDDAETGGQSQAQAWKEWDEARRDLIMQMPKAHSERLDSWMVSKLRSTDVKRLINSITSQSVPQTAVLMVTAYTKLFAGQLIEEARQVQSEWMAVEAKRPDGEDNPVAQKLRLTEKDDANAAAHRQLSAEQEDRFTDTEVHPSESIGLGRAIEECDRGPLLADHLREALRRYKKSRAGGVVGYTGLSLEGRTNTAARTGGRRLFK